MTQYETIRDIEPYMRSPYPTFDTLANQTEDLTLAKDYAFCAEIARVIEQNGGITLVVGGFVRDQVLSRARGEVALSHKDIDLEVFGISPDDLRVLCKNFGNVNLVGESFEVIKLTNPNSGSTVDISSPRTDSKTGVGHRDFNVTADPDMSPKQAAQRRDITINSMSINPLTGELQDHWGGVKDIINGVIRATDIELFGDDPLRILRVMGFAGRFGFKLDPATGDLCKSLSLEGLPTERVGEEWIKLLTRSRNPSHGMEVARQLNILEKLHPDLSILDTIEQEPDWHPEGNVWEHSKLAVNIAAKLVCEEILDRNEALVVLLGTLCHDLGKATTTRLQSKNGKMRLTSYGHAEAGLEPASRFMRELNIPDRIVRVVLPIIREHMWTTQNPNPTDKQIKKLALILQPASIRLWDIVCSSDKNGRGKPFNRNTLSHVVYQRSIALYASETPVKPFVNGRHLIEMGLTPGPKFKNILRELYDAQLAGEFSSAEEGVEYYKNQNN